MVSSKITNYIYSTDESKVKLYTVDMSNALNKTYVAEESNTKPEKASDIAIKGTTLMIVEKGKVIDYIDLFKITSALKFLLKLIILKMNLE